MPRQQLRFRFEEEGGNVDAAKAAPITFDLFNHTYVKPGYAVGNPCKNEASLKESRISQTGQAMPRYGLGARQLVGESPQVYAPLRSALNVRPPDAQRPLYEQCPFGTTETPPAAAFLQCQGMAAHSFRNAFIWILQIYLHPIADVLYNCLGDFLMLRVRGIYITGSAAD